MSTRWVVIALAGLALAACGKSSTDNTPPPQDELVGTWVSTGTNIALGLRMPPTKAKNILATFNANGSYTVVSTDSSNNNITFTGTWSAGAIANSGLIRAITVNQNVPSALTSTGIFQVTGTTMKYEVIVTGLQGWVPPTVAGGFGSTTYAGTPTTIFVQNYVKQ